MVITISASLHASTAEFARVPPSPASRSLAYSLRSKPETAWPDLTRLRAIGNPILPSPMKPIVAIAVLPLCCAASFRLFACSHQHEPQIRAEQCHLDQHNQHASAVDLRKQDLHRRH